MTQPNDFATRLEGLMESIRTEPNALKRFGLIQQQDALLANHAPAIARLVREVEWALGRNGPGGEFKCSPKARVALKAALAALNAEDKP